MDSLMIDAFANGMLLHDQAEVQAVHHDGSVALHTRSMKYGKLDSGQLVCVPQVLY
jgi:exosome complex RNA-binding protein Rrp4